MKRVVIFGGSGFLGKSLVSKLARTGAQIILAVRNVEKANKLKVFGDPGQIVALRIDITDPHAVAKVIDGADAVVNLLGILYETGTQKFMRIHYQASQILAEAIHAQPDMRYIHISAIGASVTSPALYARTKGMAEESVRAFLPDAMILRPSVVFGPDDSFFNRFGAMSVISPVLPLIGGGNTRFQPVYVEDVTDAIMLGLGPKKLAGFYELGGPDIFTFRALMEIVLEVTQRRCLLVPLPFAMARLQASLLQILPHPPLTVDQVRLLQKDNIVTHDNKTFHDLGISPRSVHAILPDYMDAYRKGGRFRH